MESAKTVEETKAVENNETESGYFVVRTVKKAVNTYKETINEYNEKYVGKNVERGKAIVRGARKDAVKLIKDLKTKGKDKLPKVELIKPVEKAFSKGAGVVTDTLNLPNKKDMEKLTGMMETLEEKIEKLSKSYSA